MPKLGSSPVNHNFFKIWTPEMAYVLGFWFADGYISKGTNHTYLVGFVSKDYEHLCKIRDLMASKHKIRVKTDGSYELIIGSKICWWDLQQLGGQSAKSLVIRMPQVPSEHVRHFVRGYIDGDGYVCFDSTFGIPVISIYSGSQEFLDEMATVIDSNTGVGITTVRKYKGKAPFIRYTGIKAKTLALWLYQNGDIALQRKADVARMFNEWQPSKYGWRSKAVTTEKMVSILTSNIC